MKIHNLVTEFMPMSRRGTSDGVFISLMSHTFIIVILK